MTNDPNADAPEAEKPSALQVLADDAERIVSSLVPDVHKLPGIVGALAAQVEKLAGGVLEPLADELLGIKPPAPEATQTPGVTAEEGAELKAQLAQQAEVIKELQAQREADRAAADQIKEAAGETPAAGANSEAAA
jgi:hypothetical protein